MAIFFDDILKYSIDFYDLNANGTMNTSFRHNTWTDFHLIPSSRPSVASPGVNVKLVEIPGRNAPIDMTNWLSNLPTFGTRSGSWEFYVENDKEPWNVIYKRLLSLLHGKRKAVVLGSDPLYFYEGRFAVDAWRSEPQYSMITINYQLNPFKKSIQPFYVHFMASTATLPQNTDFATYLRIGTASCIIPASDSPYTMYVSATGATATVYRNGSALMTVASGSSSSFAALTSSQAKHNAISISGNGSATLSYTEVTL